MLAKPSKKRPSQSLRIGRSSSREYQTDPEKQAENSVFEFFNRIGHQEPFDGKTYRAGSDCQRPLRIPRHRAVADPGCVKTLWKFQLLKCAVGATVALLGTWQKRRTEKALSGLDCLHQGPNAHDFHHSFQVVGEYMQAHLCTDATYRLG